MNILRLHLTALFALAALTMTSPAIRAQESGKAKPESPLITRGQVRLNLAGAQLALDSATEYARGKGFRMNIAVVDDGGHLLAFARMDGARPASGNTALTKAVTAATFRQETGPLPVGGTPDMLLNLSIQNAAAASGGKITTLKGGVPIVIDGQIVGALGVGGGSGEQDAEVAKAGIEALLKSLETSVRDSK
jgi:glc operon protein GlcG